MSKDLALLFSNKKKYTKYVNGNITAIFSGEYFEQGNFTNSQWKKLLVKENEECSKGIYHQHRVYYRDEFAGNKKTLTIIMFNPGTATHITNDSTINNCKEIAKKGKYDSIEIINLLTIRDPDIKRAINAENNNINIDLEDLKEYLQNLKEYLQNKNILIAWGGLSKLTNNEKTKKKKLHKTMIKNLSSVNCNIFTFAPDLLANGYPRHPSPSSYNRIKNKDEINLKKLKIENTNLKYLTDLDV